jgi:hypothetical protein
MAVPTNTTNFDAIQYTNGGYASDGTQLYDAVNKKFFGYYNTVPQVITGDGAISFTTGDQFVFLTKGSAAAITIAAPTAGSPLSGGQDGVMVTVVSETAFAHQITCASDGFNAKGSSGTATASAAANNWLTIIARNGHWRVIGNLNFTIA